MKKKLLTLTFLFSFSNLIIAQDANQQAVINTGGDGFHLDITSLLIGVVVGGVIGYFVGSRRSSN
jgi:hypothetical protein